MRAFIYDKYGYYPDDEFATSFEYNGWYFKIEISEKNDQEIHALRLMLEEINQNFTSLGSDIIMSKDGHYVSMSEYGPVVLVAIKNGDVTINDLLKLQYLFKDHFLDRHLQISYLHNLWINKTDTIENRILSSLPLDNENYRLIYLLGQYGIYIAENAIQYLLDIGFDYGNEIINKTLAHKRLDVLNCRYLFNPFNLLIDSPSRDLAELYKHEQLSLQDVLKITLDNNFSKQDASLLLARCLYPAYIFDLLEDYYELKKDIFFKAKEVYDNLDNRQLRIKKLHDALVKYYQIRPISWLE